MPLVMGELLGALDQLQQEKGFSKDALIQVIEEALAEAYRQRHEPEGEVEVRIDVSSGELHAGIHSNGEYQPIPDEEFQSAAATTARKVIFGRLRDAEREQVFQDALKHQGELASAVVDRLDGNLVFVKTDRGQGDAASEALLPPEEQIPIETYRPGQRLKVLLLEPRVGRRGPSQVVSRTNRSLVKRLLEFEVPRSSPGTCWSRRWLARLGCAPSWQCSRRRRASTRWARAWGPRARASAPSSTSWAASGWTCWSGPTSPTRWWRTPSARPG